MEMESSSTLNTQSHPAESPKLYLDIRPTETRFVELLPSSDNNADVECILRVADARYWPQIQFEALSYTWGEATDLKKILVNGLKVDIRSNLESFLRQRREQVTPVYLWVDALCINQQDNKEKNHQIPLMNLIYASARTLTIWLGPASEDSHLAIEWLSKVGHDNPFSKMPVLSRKVIQAFQNFLSRPYWSRVWIVQELILGAMGNKLERAMVTCGQDKFPWASLVIAAVRMKADQENMRQYFPNVDVILQLDSLRERVYGQLYEPGRGSITLNLDLLSRYRHFQATNPRDKVYALANIFARRKSERVEPEYEASIEKVFAETAKRLLAAGFGPDMLRLCGHRTVQTPSWVPDWSTSPGTTPLANRFMNPYDDVPWWTESEETEVKEDDGTRLIQRGFPLRNYPVDQAVAERDKRERFRRLEIAAEGAGMVSNISEIPPSFGFHSAPQEIKNRINEMVTSGQLLLMVSENDFPYLNPEMAGPGYSNNKDALTESQRITEKQFKKRLVKLFKAVDSPYHAAGTTTFEHNPTDSDMALEVKGICFDTVKVIEEPFVDEIEKDWTNATRFMVTTGKCKALATSDPSALARYETKDKLHEAFWLTLFAGQRAEEDQFNPDDSSTKRLTYADWLPEIPEHWQPSTPPLTATASGRLKAAHSFQKSNAIFQQQGYGISSSLAMDGLVPTDWTANDITSTTTLFNELGDLWSTQPYDLYHRPFDLLNVIPDPYWPTREQTDELARRKTRTHITGPLVSLPPSKAGDDKEKKPVTDASTVALATSIHEIWKSHPCIVPQGTLGRGMEKYALGRRFFVTRCGRFGLAPKEARPGDVLVVLLGVDVPVLMRRNRKHASKGGMVGVEQKQKENEEEEEREERETWEIIGEVYAHGVMDGEVIDGLNNGEGEGEIQPLIIV